MTSFLKSYPNLFLILVVIVTISLFVGFSVVQQRLFSSINARVSECQVDLAESRDSLANVSASLVVALDRARVRDQDVRVYDDLYLQKDRELNVTGSKLDEVSRSLELLRLQLDSEVQRRVAGEQAVAQLNSRVAGLVSSLSSCESDLRVCRQRLSSCVG